MWARIVGYEWVWVRMVGCEWVRGEDGPLNG